MDQYFKRPLLWDLMITGVLIGLAFVMIKRQLIVVPSQTELLNFNTNLFGAAFSSAGFILTILTILITFKNSHPKAKGGTQDAPVFELFFSTGLYHRTVSLLRNCIWELFAVCAITALTRLGVCVFLPVNIYMVNLASTLLILLSLVRCLIILSKVMALQKDSDS
jgi:hypothetical protein